ncbi:High-affinity hexose transporter HXT6 [Grifola frondosa]|uniref:High-affinity hexose transporter HXT6 n=1 Tax=Grifola frondosa TaxID=5627 RepID=A0A1C7LQ01_GRIFR|nr:High-affinity hexose transporter HXT6 [Grifola frondosa]
MPSALDADIDPALQPLEEAEILREAGRRENNDADDGAVPGPTVLSYVVMAATIQRKHARLAEPLGIEIGQPRLPELIRRFLYDQYNPTSDLPGLEVPLDECPRFKEKVSVFYSAAATYYAPSDPSGTGGMHREHIRATPLWWGTAPRFDCIFVNRDADIDGFLGLGVARVLLFFSFTFNDIRYPCALVHWFKRISDEPDEDTGMYIVKPETKRGSPVISFDKHSDATDPFFLPESPRHLLGTGRESEARKVVAELNGVPEDDPVVVDIVEELEVGIKAENEGSKSTWMECFSACNGLWKRTINGMVLRFVRQLNGQNFYYYYGNTFFKSAGTTPSSEAYSPFAQTYTTTTSPSISLPAQPPLSLAAGLSIRLQAHLPTSLPGTRPTLLQNAKVWTAQQNGTEVILADILLDNGLIKGIGTSVVQP